MPVYKRRGNMAPASPRTENKRHHFRYNYRGFFPPNRLTLIYVFETADWATTRRKDLPRDLATF